MYPYPSGDLHIGHWYIVTPTDARARFLRMNGHNVFLPIGFDAFGLPAENAAIKSGVHPATWTLRNIENMRRQFRTMGAALDWSAEVVTCLPEYYRWNQWIFLQLMKAGLAYRQMAPVDWCPKDQVVLAREQVEGADRVCWRCGTPVIKRDLEQWFFRITKYADELLDFTGIDWPEPVRLMQTNWIGRSEGAEVIFRTAPSDHHAGGAELRVFTTRPDTLFGATFMVLAPEHPLVAELTAPEQREAVEAYVAAARRETEIERLSTEREKTGVPIGADAINPVNGERIPIWIADYVLASYGTGAIMAVPGHDERDFAFAQRFGLPIVRVVAGPRRRRRRAAARGLPGQGRGRPARQQRRLTAACPGPRASPPSWRDLAARGEARATVTYRIRDWLVSRQRAWGTPIPVVYCSADCGIVPAAGERAAGAPAGGLRLSAPAAATRWRRRRRSWPPPAPAVAGRRAARRTPWTPSWTAPGTGGATSRPRQRTPPSTARSRSAGVPWTSTPAAPSTPSCTCSTAASSQGPGRPGRGPRARALQAALQPGPDPGRRRRAHEQEPRQRPGSR